MKNHHWFSQDQVTICWFLDCSSHILTTLLQYSARCAKKCFYQKWQHLFQSSLDAKGSTQSFSTYCTARQNQRKELDLSLESYTENLAIYFSIQSRNQEVFFLSRCCEIQNHARSHFLSAWTIPSLSSHTCQSTHILPGCCTQTKGVFLTDAWLQFILNWKRS